MPRRAHLHRLSNVWLDNPIFFLTACVSRRRQALANPAAAHELRKAWVAAQAIHGWRVGRFVIIPDHVHFFARPRLEAKTLAGFMRDWKKWTARRILAIDEAPAPLWQPEFFDHLLRSPQSYAEKWEYVRMNPVRAGLARNAADWPFSGEIESLSF
jgi:putative transposase